MAKDITNRRKTGTTTDDAASPLSPFRLGRTAIVYLRVLKPRETVLLSIIGLCTAVAAGGGSPPLDRFALAAIAIVVGSGGTNGLTNFLDRKVDARMLRTQRRMLPSGLIQPPEKALAWAAFLVVVALTIALYLHPYAFISGVTGVTAGLIARKTWATHFLGTFSSCGPVLVGWFAINPEITATPVLLCIIIALWLPIHVWNLMTASRDDYLQAGVNIFPITKGAGLTARVSVVLSLFLYAASVALYFLGDYGLVYFVAANVGSILMVRATLKMLSTGDKSAAYRAFKLSAYPFLGLIFLGLCIDIWVSRIV